MSFEVAPGCDGCGICVFACPKGAIRRSTGDDPSSTPYEVFSLNCNDCGKCAIVCPQRVLGPDPKWAECRGRGCPIVTSRLEGWACTEGWARCERCQSALWKPPDGGKWICARCDTESRVICPKIRRHIAQTSSDAPMQAGSEEPSVAGVADTGG